MATSSSLSTSLFKPDLIFPNSRNLRSSGSLFDSNRRYKFSLRVKIRALKSEEAVVELREDEDSFGLNGNGRLNGSVKKYGNVNGGANGSLVKYVNGNGGVKSNGEVPKTKNTKKTVEEIGQEDAWFKEKNPSQPQVYCYISNFR